MLERHARLPIDSPRQIILVVALITLIISPFVLKVEFSTDVQAFLPQSEEVETYDLITEDFGKDSSVVNLYLTSVSGNNVLTMPNLVDILQIPAFLCRQTDLIEAAAKTNKIIHVKKGQFLNAQSMIKVVEKFRAFGHTNKIILCERGTMFGYNDLVVDSRNLVWMKSPKNLVSMDITHCLQQPAQQHADGTVKAGGLREFIPLMGKIALVAGVDAIFMEVHDNPEAALCDGPTSLRATASTR